MLLTDNQVIETIAVEGVTDEMILLYANKYPNCFIICGMKLEGRLSRSFLVQRLLCWPEHQIYQLL